MSSIFRFKACQAGLSARQIAAIRRVSPYAISEIQRRVSTQESLLDIPVFSGDWPESAARVVALLDEIEATTQALNVYLVQVPEEARSVEEHLRVDTARERLQTFLSLTLEQDLHGQQEEGYIVTPERDESPPTA